MYSYIFYAISTAAVVVSGIVADAVAVIDDSVIWAYYKRACVRAPKCIEAQTHGTLLS